MSIFDKIFGNKKKNQETTHAKESALDKKRTPDELFVEQFKEKGGKFLYCLTEEEAMGYLKAIFDENSWKSAQCFDNHLQDNLNVLGVAEKSSASVFYTTCEHLIAEDGSILFSSVQLNETKLMQYPINFIVFATTSQLIQDKDKALTSIKYRFKKEIPSNISAIKDYMPQKKDPNFLNYGNTNSKNLYLLLLEDL